MNDTQWDGVDPERTRLRALVARIDDEVTILSLPDASVHAKATERLTEAWNGLVTALALGPEPEVRRCPFCQRSVLRAATRCRYCMKSSPAAHARQAETSG